MTTTDLETAAELLLQPITPDESDEAAPLDAPAEDDDDEIEQTAEAEADDTDDTAEDGEYDDEPDDTDEDDSPEAPDLFDVKVNGEIQTVTLEDLKRTYSAQKYADQGMEYAANRRKEAEALFAEVDAQRQQLLDTFSQLQTNGIASAPQRPDMAMLDTDPIGYMHAKAAYEQANEIYQNQQQMVQMQAQQHEQARAQANSVYLDEQRALLKTLVPEFGDAKQAPEFQRKLAKVAVDHYQLGQAEIEGLKDARYVRVLADAMRWQELQSGKPKPKQSPPKNVKPAGRRGAPKSQERQKARARARKSGNLEDFAALILDPKTG